MKKTKRMVCLLLALGMLVTLFPAAVQAGLDDPYKPDVIIAQSFDNNMLFFPDVVNVPASVYNDPALPNGKLLLAYYKNAGHAASGPGDAMGTIMMTESTDNGLTWSEPEVFLDWREEKNLETRDPNFAILNDGTLLFTFFSRRYASDEFLQTYIMRSEDGGETWSEPQVIQSEHLAGSYSAKQGSIAVFDDDEILVPLYGAPVGKTSPDIVFMRSKDKGVTWDEEIVFQQSDGTTTYNECAIVAMEGDTAYAFVREPGYIYKSTDRFKTWEQIGKEGSGIHQPCLTRLDDNSIFATWTVPPEYGGGNCRPVKGKLFYPELGWNATAAKTIYTITDQSWDMGDATTVLTNDNRLLTVYYDSVQKIIGGTFSDREEWEPGDLTNPEVSGNGARNYVAQEAFDGITDTAYPASGRDFVPVRLNGGTESDCKFDIVTEEDNKYIALRNYNAKDGRHPNLLSQKTFDGNYSAAFDFRFPDETDEGGLQHVYISPMYVQWGTSNDTQIRLEKNQVSLMNGSTVRDQESIEFDSSKWYSFRMAQTDTSVYVKVWERGTEEPFGWTVQYTGYNFAGRSPMQFRLGYLGKTTADNEHDMSFYVDNFEIYKTHYLKVTPDSLDGTVGDDPVQLKAVLTPALPPSTVTTDGVRIQINDIYRKWQNVYRLSEVEVFGAKASVPDQKVNLAQQSDIVTVNSNVPLDPSEERYSKLENLTDGEKTWWTWLTPELEADAWKTHYIEFNFSEDVNVSELALSIDGGLGTVQGIKNIDVQVKDEEGAWQTARKGYELAWQDAPSAETLTVPVAEPVAPVAWTSDDPDVASVDADGMVTYLKEGETTIHAAYDTYNTFDVPVKVAPAPQEDTRTRLSVILITGQSNAYGAEGDAAASVRPPSGTTFYWNNETLANFNPDDPFSPESTYGSIGDAMTELLTTEGRGGFHGAFAAQWAADHPGEKLLLINTGFGGSSVSGWMPGQGHYTYAKDVFAAVCNYLASDEISQEYRIGDVGYLWLQGEKDMDMSAADYVSKYTAMHNGILGEFGTREMRPTFGAIMMTRVGHNSNTNDTDLSGPRLAQYWMHNQTASPYDKVHLVSNITDKWISDAAVAAYFADAYPDDTWTEEGYSYARPTTLAEVHPDVHYRQAGYNEIGKDAAKNLGYVLSGAAYPAESVVLIDQKGQEVADGMSIGETQPVVPLAYPLYSAQKAQLALSGDPVVTVGDYYQLIPQPAEDGQTASLSVTSGSVSQTYQILSEMAPVMQNPIISGKGNRVPIAQEDFDDITAAAYPASGRDFFTVREGGGTEANCKFDIVEEGDGKYIALRNTNNGGEHPNLYTTEAFSGEFGVTLDFRFPTATKDIEGALQHVYIRPMYTYQGATNDALIRLEKNNITLLNGSVARSTKEIYFDDDTWYSLRIAVTDTAIYAKVWERGTAEPAEWSVKYEQYSGLASRTPMQFRIGYLGRTKDGTEQSFYVDNLSIFRAYHMQVTPASLRGMVGESQQIEAAFAPEIASNEETVVTDGLRININEIYNMTEKKYRIAEVEIYDKNGNNIAPQMSVNTETPAAGKLGVMTTNIPEEEPALDRDYSVAHLIDGDIDSSKSWFITATPPLADNAWKDHFIQFDFTEPQELAKVILYCDENLALTLGVKNIDIQVKQDGSWVDQRPGVELTWPDMDAEQNGVNAQTIPMVPEDVQGYRTKGVRFNVNEIYKMWEVKYRVSEIELFGALASAPEQLTNLADTATVSTNVPNPTAPDQRDYVITNVKHVVQPGGVDATEAEDKGWFVFLTELMDGESYTGPAYNETYIQFDFAEEVILADAAISIDNGLGTVQGIKNLDVQILDGDGAWVTIKPNVELAWQNTAPYETIDIPLFEDSLPGEWTSDDPEIASIQPNGLVTFLKEGKTTIRGSYPPYNDVAIPVEVYYDYGDVLLVQLDEESSYLQDGAAGGSVVVDLRQFKETGDTVDVWLAVYGQDGLLRYCKQQSGIEVASGETETVTFSDITAAVPGGRVKVFAWYTDQELVPAAEQDSAVIPAAE